MKAGGVAPSLLFCYGVPGLVAALPVIPVAVILPTWYARDLGLGFALTGIVLALARLVDFASDAVIGVLSDRWHWRGLRFKPWIFTGALLAALGLVVLAYPPVPARPLMLGLGAVLLFSGWTAFMIPYSAWGAELSGDAHGRSLLVGAREVAGLLGMLLALALPVWAADYLGTDAPPALVLLTLAAVVMGIPALTLLLTRVPEAPPRHVGAQVSAHDLLALLSFPPCRRTLVCWFVNSLANGLPAVLFPLIVSDLLMLDDVALFELLVCYFGAAVVAAPLWLLLARERGKSFAWRVAIACNMLVFTQVLWLDASNAQWFATVCVLSGATLGADLSLPPSLQADVMQHDRERSGRARTASAFALWSMATKLALALAVAVAFLSVGVAGETGAPIERVPLLLCYCGLPVLLKTAVLVMLRGDPLSLDRQPAPQKAQAGPDQW